MARCGGATMMPRIPRAFRDRLHKTLHDNELASAVGAPIALLAGERFQSLESDIARALFRRGPHLFPIGCSAPAVICTRRERANVGHTLADSRRGGARSVFSGSLTSASFRGRVWPLGDFGAADLFHRPCAVTLRRRPKRVCRAPWDLRRGSRRTDARTGEMPWQQFPDGRTLGGSAGVFDLGVCLPPVGEGAQRSPVEARGCDARAPGAYFGKRLPRSTTPGHFSCENVMMKLLKLAPFQSATTSHGSARQTMLQKTRAARLSERRVFGQCVNAYVSELRHDQPGKLLHISGPAMSTHCSGPVRDVAQQPKIDNVTPREVADHTQDSSIGRCGLAMRSVGPLGDRSRERLDPRHRDTPR